MEKNDSASIFNKNTQVMIELHQKLHCMVQAYWHDNVALYQFPMYMCVGRTAVLLCICKRHGIA